MLFYFIVNISHSCTGVLSVLVEGEHDNSHLLKHNSPLLLLSSPSCLILISLKFKFAVYVTLSPTLTSSQALIAVRWRPCSVTPRRASSAWSVCPSLRSPPRTMSSSKWGTRVSAGLTSTSCL